MLPPCIAASCLDLLPLPRGGAPSGAHFRDSLSLNIYNLVKLSVSYYTVYSYYEVSTSTTEVVVLLLSSTTKYLVVQEVIQPEERLRPS